MRYTSIMPRTKQHLDALLHAPPLERSAAAEALLASLEGSDPEEGDIDQAWVDEIQRRIDEDAPGISADKVFADGRSQLGK